jgi:FkbM family methyltransferase
MDIKGAARGLVERLPGPLRRAARRAYYARLLRAADERAEPDLAFLRRVVGRGDYVVDAGAHMGLYTRFLSGLVGPDGRVYSVEPLPETHDVLVSNVRRLGLDNVVPLSFALSDEEGPLEMEIPVWPGGGENLYEARAAAGGTGSSLRRITVPARRLDTLVPQDRIAFVKCDVEGHELRCLAGAAETVRRSRPVWLLEVWGDPDQRGSHADQVFGAMAALGYEAHCYDGAGVQPRRPGRTSVNYWFLLPEHVLALAGGRSS